MARLFMTHVAGGDSTWRRIPGTKEEVAAMLQQAIADGVWPTVQFEGREEVMLNPASVLWVADS